MPLFYKVLKAANWFMNLPYVVVNQPKKGTELFPLVPPPLNLHAVPNPSYSLHVHALGIVLSQQYFLMSNVLEVILWVCLYTRCLPDVQHSTYSCISNHNIVNVTYCMRNAL